MKYLFMLLFLVACGAPQQPGMPYIDPTIRPADPLFERGPKYGPGCYKVKYYQSKSYEGCTFYSYQGSMFITNPRTKEKTWAVIVNEQIRCLGRLDPLIPEESVRSIKCPERYYH